MAALQALQAQVAQLAAELTATRTELAQARQVADQAHATAQAAGTAAAQGAQNGGGAPQGLAEMQAAVVAMQACATALQQRREQGPSLVDNRGLGRPTSFDNTEDKFQRWSEKIESFVCAVYPDLTRIMEWSADMSRVIEERDIEEEFGTLADDTRRVDGLQQMLQQFFHSSCTVD